MSRKEFGVPFYELLVAVREGVSTPQQEQKLEQILLSDPEARQAYYEATDIDQGLTEIATFPRQLTSVAPPALREHSRWRTLVRYGAIAVASLAIGAALEWLIVSMPLRDQLVQRQRIAATASPPQFVATLVRSTDCTWAHEKSPLFEGQRLLSKDLQLNEGVAEFRLDSGIRLVLEGPSKLKINSATNRGTVSVRTIETTIRIPALRNPERKKRFSSSRRKFAKPTHSLLMPGLQSVKAW